MRILAIVCVVLFACVIASAQLQTINGSDLISTAPVKLNGNFAYLNGVKPTRFFGAGAPGTVAGSVRGDFYQDTANNLTYQCFVALVCTGVGAGNWVLVSGLIGSVVNDTNVTGSIASGVLTLGWIGVLAAGRLNSNVVQSVNNDTNITGSITAQIMSLGWTGVLAKARIIGTAVYNDQGNAYSAGDQDFRNVSSFEIRVAAGLTTTVNGRLGYDSTNNMLHGAQVGADALIPQFTVTPVNGHCASWVVSGSNYKLGDVTCVGVVGGSITQFQYNNSGALGGVLNFTSDGTNPFFKAISSPGTPAAGFGVPYLDVTSKNIAIKDDAGVIKHGVQTDAGAVNNYVGGVNDDGTLIKSRPSCATLSDSAASCNLDATNAANIGSGILPIGRLPAIAKSLEIAGGYCNNATASPGLDLPTSNAANPVCITGTNIQKGALNFVSTAATINSGQFTFRAPLGTTGTLDFNLTWNSAGTTGNMKWFVGVSCTATANTATDDPTFTDSMVTTAVPGTTLRIQTSSITGVTGCSAGNLVHIRIKRDTNDGADTLGSSVNLINAETVIRVTPEA